MHTDLGVMNDIGSFFMQRKLIAQPPILLITSTPHRADRNSAAGIPIHTSFQ
jgi:hypothetical protein